MGSYGGLNGKQLSVYWHTLVETLEDNESDLAARRLVCQAVRYEGRRVMGVFCFQGDVGLDQRQRLPQPDGGAAGVRRGHRHAVRGLLRLPPGRGHRLQLHQEEDRDRGGGGNQQRKGETQDPGI